MGHFTARASASQFTWLALRHQAKRIVLVVFLALLAGPAFASASCDAINAFWGTGSTIGGPGVSTTIDKDYLGPFDPGEYLTYSATTTGSKGSNYNSVRIWDDTYVTGYEADDDVSPINSSNLSYTLHPDSQIYISQGTYNENGGSVVLFTQVNCAMNNPAPIAGNVNATASYNSGATSSSIAVSLTGGSHTGIAIGTGPSHGTAVVSDANSILFTPTIGYAGTDSFTYTATGPGGTSAAATVSVTISSPTLNMSPSGTTLNAAVATAYSQTFSPSGGLAPYSRSQTGSLPTGLSFNTSTGILSGIPTQAGSFNITVSATDSSTGTGPFPASRNYTLTVAAPTLAITPNTLPAMVNPVHYSQSMTTSGGTAPYTYAMTGGSLPVGLTMSAAGVLSGIPVTGGAYSFNVTSTDATSFSTTITYSGTVGYATPTVGAVSTSVNFNTAKAIDLSGAITGTYASISVVGAPAHGTTSVSGDVVTYTPTPGYFGSDSFTYTATGPGGTSAAATVTLTIATPGAPTASATSASVVYNTAKLVDLSGFITGVHWSLSVTTGPAHGTTAINGDVVTYTPASGYYGADSFAYTATGPGGTSAAATVTLTIATPGAPIAGATSESVNQNTAKTIDLSGFITGVYSGIAVATGPAHGTTSVSGTVITYTPTSGYFGPDSFTYTATGPGGTSAAATVTLTIAGVQPAFTPAPGALDDAMAAEHYSKTFSVAGGSAYTVSGGALPLGLSLSTAGVLTGTLDAASAGIYHFTISANVGGAPATASYDLVVIPNAVTVPNRTITITPGSTPLPVDLTAGATGGPFTAAILGTVSPPQAGTAEITMGDVASIDSVWSHKFYLKFYPNPAYSGTVLVGYTLIGANGSSSGTVQFIASLDANGVANNFDHLLKDFVQARGSLLATGVGTPGLRQRRSMAAGTSPGTINVSPSDNSITMNFASSLAQLRSWGEAGNAAETLAAGDPEQAMPFNFWIDGTATLHLRDDDDGDEHWGRFALVSVGGDYLVDDRLLLGLALHADFMDDNADTTTVEGTGLLIGPYLSAEIIDGVFLDASIYYGRSWNEVTTSIFGGSFETERLLAKASLEGQWALTEALTVRPQANLFYLHETTGQYTVTDGLGSAITIAGFTTDQLRLSAGGTLDYRMDLGEGLTVTPYVGAQLGLSLTQQDEATLFTTLSTGFDLSGPGSWTLGGAVEANLESDSFKSISAKANLRSGF